MICCLAGLHVGYFMQDRVDEVGWFDGEGKGFVDADRFGVVGTASGAAVGVVCELDFPAWEAVRCECFLQNLLRFAKGSQRFAVNEIHR